MGFLQGDEAARGTILAAFQAWGWRADPHLDAAHSPGILSSVAAAPGASRPCAHTTARSAGLQSKLRLFADDLQTSACSIAEVKPKPPEAAAPYLH